MPLARVRPSAIAYASLLALFSLFATLCAVKTIKSLASGFRGCEIPCEVSACRSMAHLSGETCLALPVVKVESISPVDRTRLIAASWETIPRAVEPVEWGAVAYWRGNLLVPSYAPCDTELRLRALGFSKSATNGFEALWIRSPVSFGRRDADAEAAMEIEMLSRRLLNESTLSSELEQPPSAFSIHVPAGLRDLEPSGFAGVAVVLVALVVLWLKLRDGPSQCSWSIMAGAIVFATTGLLAVSTGLTPPNGLGVYAGKAKLILTHMRIPAGFWTSAAFSIYQPAYPPGMVVFPLCVWLLSGSVSELASQLIVPGILAVLCAELLSGMAHKNKKWGNDNHWRHRVVPLIIGVSYVVSPLTFRMAVGFYAEPMAALCLVVGCRSVLRGKVNKGWLLIGMTGIFRPEGVVYVVTLCLSVLCARLVRHSHMVLSLPTIVLAALPCMMWKSFCAVVGTEIQDIDFQHVIEFGRIKEAICIASLWIRHNIFSSAGFIGLAALLSFLRSGRRRFWLTGFAAWMFAVSLGLLALGFSTSSDLSWVVETWYPRFLWTAAAPWIAMLVDGEWSVRSREFCDAPLRR